MTDLIWQLRESQASDISPLYDITCCTSTPGGYMIDLFHHQTLLRLNISYWTTMGYN